MGSLGDVVHAILPEDSFDYDNFIKRSLDCLQTEQLQKNSKMQKSQNKTDNMLNFISSKTPVWTSQIHHCQSMNCGDVVGCMACLCPSKCFKGVLTRLFIFVPLCNSFLSSADAGDRAHTLQQTPPDFCPSVGSLGVSQSCFQYVVWTFWDGPHGVMGPLDSHIDCKYSGRLHAALVMMRPVVQPFLCHRNPCNHACVIEIQIRATILCNRKSNPLKIDSLTIEH